MTTKADIIAAIQFIADATGNNNLRIALGAPGSHLRDSSGQMQPTGKAWIPTPRMWDTVAGGLAKWFDESGASVAVDNITIDKNLSGELEVKPGGLTSSQMDLDGDFTWQGSHDFSGGEAHVAVPTENSHAASKQYVDQLIQGLEWQDSVLGRAINTPPAAVEGDRYIIGVTPTGAWVGHAEEIAEFTDPNWEFTAKKEGLACWVDDENLAYVYNGTAWVKLTGASNHNDLGGLQGGTSDEYYHLTSDEHTDVVNKLGDLGYKQNLAPTTNLTKGDGSPWTIDQIDDANSVVGSVLYIASDGNWERADANAKATTIGFGMALEAGSGSKKILLPGGVFRNDAWSWTPGAVLYVSESTPGAMTHVPPLGSGDYVFPVAIAKTSKIIILCPSLTLVKIL